MEKLFIERKASDNKYLHRDFHISADIGIKYVGEKFGIKGVKEYLTQYAKSYFSVLANDVLKNGLKPLENYFIKIFAAEERYNFLTTYLSENELVVKILKCPALEYMASVNYTPSKWFNETTKTVYPVLAEMCNLSFELMFFDDFTGRAEYSFKKKN